MKKDTLMIIDGNALIHRAWHALPPLSTSKGVMINAVYGFTAMLLKAIKEVGSTYVAVTFDKKGPTFRHMQFADYKAKRIAQPDEFYEQFSHVRRILQALGIPFYELDGFEADDVIATIVAKLAGADMRIVIATGDLDTLQLVSSQVHVLVFRKGITDAVLYDEQAVVERFGGLQPLELQYYKALRGDPSDNIPGVQGIGEKTAIELVLEYKTLDALYDAIENGHDTLKKGVREKLVQGKEQAYQSLFLSQLVSDAPVELDIEKCKLGSYHASETIEIFQELEFKSLLPRLQNLPQWSTEATLMSSEGGNGEKRAVYRLCDQADAIDEFLELLEKQSIFAVDTETTSISTIDADLVGISFSFEEGVACYIPRESLSPEQTKKIKIILEDESIGKIGHNAKYDSEIFAHEGMLIKGIVFDTMIAAYLLNPGVRDYSLDALCFSEFGYQKIAIESLIGKGRDQISMRDVPLPDIAQYASEDADFTYRLYTLYKDRLEEFHQTKLFEEIEMPLIETLVELEENGVAIDVEFLNRMEKDVREALKVCREKIFRYAGEEFNIGSPIQLKKILFEKLAIPALRIRKGKTGLSTAASELEKMRHMHPVIECILEYRELTKLLTTYIAVLPTLVNAKTGRVHANFNQTITATGRLSSSNPNVQNIPIRNGLGKEIRKSFIAEKGYQLLAADYSQIELRIVASIAHDEKMIEAFSEGQDIHSVTASEIYGVPLAEVTSDMRRAAKAINFGIIYGMGPQGLAENVGISYGDAAAFIEQYFFAYPAIRTYMDETIAQTRKVGYCETLFGRRRYLPELNSSVSQVRNAAERMAINMPVQGTEADIIKIAMIRVFRNIVRAYNGESQTLKDKPVRFILQVHDELVFEIRKDLLPEIAPLIRQEMEGVMELAAPLVVDLKQGINWGDMEKISLEPPI